MNYITIKIQQILMEPRDEYIKASDYLVTIENEKGLKEAKILTKPKTLEYLKEKLHL